MSTTTTSELEADALLAQLDREGTQAVIERLTSAPLTERVNAWMGLQRGMTKRGWRGGSADGIAMDDYVAIVRAGIDDIAAAAKEESDPERAAKITDTANIMSYNLTADLADCWPGDTATREARHFEEGLRAADDCIRWRNELGKPADRRSMAWWGRGMHLMSLGDDAAAILSFDEARRLAMEADGGAPMTATSRFDVLLNTGYRGIARSRNGEENDDLATALELLRTQAEGTNKEVAEDAAFCISQLEAVVERYGG